MTCSACTMEVFSIIKSSLIPDDSNPIHKYFRVGQQVGTCGPEMIWKIFEAVGIDDDKKASVFIFNKKVADKLHKPRRREIVSEILRRDVKQLSKISNKSILKVYHGLEEGRDSLAFASEPVSGSLANLLDKSFTNTSQEKTWEFMEHEVECGIFQITEALMYVHGVERLIHRNINPSSIIITKSGHWKLAGFGFAEKTLEGKESFSCKAWSIKSPKMAQPDLNYIAPEIQTTEVTTYVSDMFSFGMVICTIYNGGKSLIDAQYNAATYVNQLDTLTQKFCDIAYRMPPALVDPVEKMINKDIRYRPTSQLFSLLKMFHDPAVTTLQQLDELHVRNSREKSEIFSQLSQNIPLLPKNIRCNRLLPCLHREMSSPDSITSALPTFLTLVQNVSHEEYLQFVFSEVQFILNCSKPIQATIILLERIDLLITKCSTGQIRTDIVPFILNCLKSNSADVKEGALKALLVVKEHLDDHVLRVTILPSAKQLYLSSQDVTVKLVTLSCVKHLLVVMNTTLIKEEVLPFLVKISVAQEATLILAVVGIYKHMLKKNDSSLTSAVLAKEVMPSLIPHTVNPGFNAEQFVKLMDVLHEMLAKIDIHRRNHVIKNSPSTKQRENGSNDTDFDSSRHFLFVENKSPPAIQKSRTAPSSPEFHGCKDEREILPLGKADSPRRYSLVPPGGGNPGISLITDDSVHDRNRRPSLQNLGNHNSQEPHRKSSTGSLFSFNEGRAATQRRGSFQALGETMMQLFTGK